MPIDYNIWGQHTIVEARYGRESAIHIRIPEHTVAEARDRVTSKDMLEYNPLIDLSNQLYQFHLLNGTRGDAYINNVPFQHVNPLLWHLHKRPEARNKLLIANKNIQIQDYLVNHTLPTRPGKIWLHPGHEKYGIFDLIPEDSFMYMQFHRVALYAAFLLKLDHKFAKSDLNEALPDSIREEVKNGASLEKCIEKSLDLRLDGNFTIHSMFESLTLIPDKKHNAANTLVVDEESSRLKKTALKVCPTNSYHDFPIYWTIYRGRKIYRIVDPADEEAPLIRHQLRHVKEQECSLCIEKIVNLAG